MVWKFSKTRGSCTNNVTNKRIPYTWWKSYDYIFMIILIWECEKIIFGENANILKIVIKEGKYFVAFKI